VNVKIPSTTARPTKPDAIENTVLASGSARTWSTKYRSNRYVAVFDAAANARLEVAPR
jgi:hypothetical protein